MEISREVKNVKNYSGHATMVKLAKIDNMNIIVTSGTVIMAAKLSVPGTYPHPVIFKEMN